MSSTITTTAPSDSPVLVLRNKYELLFRIADNGDNAGPRELWRAEDPDDGKQYLVTLWRYAGAEPDAVQRALWDAELRTMYRIGSSPGAEDMLVTMKDAGVDRAHRCFVMVVRADGYDTLAQALADGSLPELTDRSTSGRRRLWSHLRQIATGLRLLHEQHVIHRDVRAENLLLDPVLGMSSARLGGFEWSVRLGTAATDASPVTWATPPERLEAPGPIRMEDDWFGFGVVAARCLLALENFSGNAPPVRFRHTLRAIQRSSNLQISPLERSLLERLVASNPRDRLTRAGEIDRLIGDVIARLDGIPETDDGAPLILAFDPANEQLVSAATEAGFVHTTTDPQRAFNPRDPEHAANLRTWLTEDFADAEVHSIVSNKQVQHFLVGARLSVRIKQYTRFDHAIGANTETWRAAWCVGPRVLSITEHTPASARAVPPKRVTVATRREIHQDQSRLHGSASWQPLIPSLTATDELRVELARFHEFLRCTNQIELLMRDAEIFGFKRLSHTISEGTETIEIEEGPRSRPVPDFAKTQGMSAFLEQQSEAGKRGGTLVRLTDESQDSLGLEPIGESEHWRVYRIAGGRVTLTRPAGSGGPPPPERGLLRSFGMSGQIRLIRRRKKAIDRLTGHSFLLRSLSNPGRVYIDTNDPPLAMRLPEKSVDQPKRAAIEDILRVRPIYALQGPPGTGKTTLVAWLIREILQDDPVAQILVTAQAHGAVDVLRQKVISEAFDGVDDDKKPLAIRLRRQDPVDTERSQTELESDSVEGVALRVLQQALITTADGPDENEVQRQWRVAAEQMVSEIRSFDPRDATSDFLELVKRGASLIYCTTSAGELEALADMTLSFDWSIVEEAGKAHGFDLALPLQAGHRWLLIGDQYQLSPYRFPDYSAAVSNLEAVVTALLALPDGGAGLVDTTWAHAWRDRTEEERVEFADFVRSWLRTFARIFTECSQASGGPPRLTSGTANGAAAGLITGQHRMHPTIGKLISDTYYESKLSSMTQASDGSIRPDVVHPFVAPGNIQGRAVVWLDIPAAADGVKTELGPADGFPRFTSEVEVDALKRFLRSLRRADGHDEPLDLAVLSPYGLQARELRKIHVPDGFELRSSQRTPNKKTVAHTVDSFQGNQAKVIAVSLVRNNTEPPGEGLGFLREAARMNVLLSRAECLLVLVGSFDFFRHQVSLVSPADHFHPLSHLRRATDTLATWFDDGTALRLPVSDLSE